MTNDHSELGELISEFIRRADGRPFAITHRPPYDDAQMATIYGDSRDMDKTVCCGFGKTITDAIRNALEAHPTSSAAA